MYESRQFFMAKYNFFYSLSFWQAKAEDLLSVVSWLYPFTDLTGFGGTKMRNSLMLYFTNKKLYSHLASK
jgi:hypothetical protein